MTTTTPRFLLLLYALLVSATLFSSHAKRDSDVLKYVEIELPNGKTFKFPSRNGAFAKETEEDAQMRLLAEAHTYCAFLSEDPSVPPHDKCTKFIVTKVTEKIIEKSTRGFISERSKRAQSSSGTTTKKKKRNNQRHRSSAPLSIEKSATAVGAFGLDTDFFETAQSIYAPAYGTDQIGILLYSLIRFQRPVDVVELGFGYTTPFLARALADNAINVKSERRETHSLREAQILHDAWYEENDEYEDDVLLTVFDDASQRDDRFRSEVEEALVKLGLRSMVRIRSDVHHSTAHQSFRANSLGLVWNDAQWDPDYLRHWWPLLRKDGGLLLLHNVVGNGEDSRWCVASPRRTLQEIFPDEVFEFITLMEPHKAYQGSVAMLRRLDPSKAPEKYGFFWGGQKKGTRQYKNIIDALDRD